MTQLALFDQSTAADILSPLRVALQNDSFFASIEKRKTEKTACICSQRRT